jgi:hypothetical protein
MKTSKAYKNMGDVQEGEGEISHVPEDGHDVQVRFSAWMTGESLEEAPPTTAIKSIFFRQS